MLEPSRWKNVLTAGPPGFAPVNWQSAATTVKARIGKAVVASDIACAINDPFRLISTLMRVFSQTAESRVRSQIAAETTRKQPASPHRNADATATSLLNRPATRHGTVAASSSELTNSRTAPPLPESRQQHGGTNAQQNPCPAAANHLLS